MNQEAVALNSSFAEPASTTESALPSEQKSGLPNGQTIRDCVATALDNYFSSLDKSDGIFEVYQMVMAEVEAPLSGYEAYRKKPNPLIRNIRH
jgi:DNA-binding protein Fis